MMIQQKRMPKACKILLFLLLFAPAALALAAETWELSFSAEFPVVIYQFPCMLPAENIIADNIGTMYTFTDRDGSFELRYTFFSQTRKGVENIYRAFALFVIPIIHAAAGFEVDLDEVELYDDQDVFEEYNGNIGVSVFIPSPASDYGGGYAFMLLSFYCKIDQGIVMQTVLFDDIEFAGTNEFAEVSHSFRFSE
jgi:hypothetical protein